MVCAILRQETQKAAAMKSGYKQGGMLAAGAPMPQKKHRKGHPILGADRATKRQEDHFTEVLAFTAAPGTKDFLKKACMELGMRVGSRANASLFIRMALERYIQTEMHKLSPKLRAEFDKI